MRDKITWFCLVMCSNCREEERSFNNLTGPPVGIDETDVCQYCNKGTKYYNVQFLQKSR